MNLRAPPVFRAEEFPDADPNLLDLITRGFRELNNALAGVADRSVVTGSFVSAASGVTTVAVKSPLPGKPRHYSLTLRRDDNADFSAAWSHWLLVGSDGLQVKFIGLPASTRHAYSIEII